MKQGPLGAKEIIQGKQNKHCFLTVEKGSYYPGSGIAQFNIDYSKWFLLCFSFLYWQTAEIYSGSITEGVAVMTGIVFFVWLNIYKIFRYFREKMYGLVNMLV